MQTANDSALVAQARRGSADAFGALVERYQSAVYNVCYRLMAESRDAEDMTQETFIRAYQRLHLYDATRPFGPWIKRVAANVCYNEFNRRPNEPLPLDEERDVTPHDNPAQLAQIADEAEQLRQALNRLPSRYRAVVELRHFQALSYQEIADTLNLPLSDVKSDLFRARRQLAQWVDPDA